MKHVVVIGGGTGTFAVLSGLKQYKLAISAIITMMDSGGSTGRLRDQYGVLPPGDVRQALVALSESDKVWRQLFLYRFNSGDLKGHNFGNLFLTALEHITGSFEEAVQKAQELLKIRGEIIPITLEKAHIRAELGDGTILNREALIDKREKRTPIKTLSLDQVVRVNSKALATLEKADYIIVGPGDLYTSILPNFLFKQFVETYQKSSAKKIFILNLMNEAGQTDNFKASDYIKIYEQYLGDKPFDTIIINKSPIPPAVEQYYSKHGGQKIINDLPSNYQHVVLSGDLLHEGVYKKKAGDALHRSLVRHDPHKLAHFIWTHIMQNKNN